MAQITDISKSYFASLVPFVVQAKSVNPKNTQEVEKFQQEVDLFVREKLNSLPLPEAIKEEVKRDAETSLKVLQECRAIHLSQDWLLQPIRNGRLNLACPKAPSVCLGGTHHAMMPCIGYYAEIYHMSTCFAAIRLHPAQVSNIPKSVIDAIGDVKGKKVDYIFSVENISELKDLKEKHKLPLEFNLVTHGWAHRHYQKGKDLTEMVSMGIYEAEGVYPIPTRDGVSFNTQQVLPVHCHPTGDNATAFSPNNAHVGISGNTPFSSFWSILKLGDRIIVTKQVLLHEYDRVILKAFFESKSLNDVFTNLRLHEGTLLQPLQMVAESFELGKANADQLFASLSNSLKNSVYYQTWFDKWQNKQLPAPHGDFGRAAFHCDKSLDARYHCNGKERAAIIRASCMRLGHDYQKLVDGIQGLFASPKEIPPSTVEQREKNRLLKPIIEFFESGQVSQGFELFNRLDPVHQHGVYQYVWETFGCPRDFPGDFGAASFHSSSTLDAERWCDGQKRIKALLCYLYSI